MPEYIEREALLELINEDCMYKNPTNEYARGCNEVCDWAIKTITNIPTADVVEVKHGEWLECPNGLNTYCSVCKKAFGTIYDIDIKPYCPNCGAKMDGK